MKLCLFCELKSARYFIASFILLLLILGFSHKAQAERIVVIDGALTEILYELNAEKHLVGRDVTSTYPAEVVKLPSVGYMRQLSAEGILSLNPSLVITTKDAKPQKVFTQLKDAGIEVVQIENRFTVEGVFHKITEMGKALDKLEQAEALISKIKKELEISKVKVAKMAGKSGKTAMFVLGMRNGNMMVAGSGTRADEMLRLAGVENPPAGFIQGYKPLTAESAILFNPGYLITMQHGLQSSGGRDKILNATAISLTKAGQQKNLVVMDNSFLNFGPRIGEEILKLAQQVYGKQVSVDSDVLTKVVQ